MSGLFSRDPAYEEFDWSELETVVDQLDFDSTRDWFSSGNARFYTRLLDHAERVDTRVRDVAGQRRKLDARRSRKTPEELERRVNKVEENLVDLKDAVEDLTDHIVRFNRKFHEDVDTWKDRSGLSEYSIHDEDLPKNRRRHIRNTITYIRDCVIDQGVNALADNFDSLHDRVSDEYVDVVEKIESVCIAFLKIIRDWVRGMEEYVTDQTADPAEVAEEILLERAMGSTDDRNGRMKWSIFVTSMDSELDSEVSEHEAFNAIKDLHRTEGHKVDYNGISVWNTRAHGHGPKLGILEDEQARKSDEELIDEYIDLVVAIDLDRFDHPDESDQWIHGNNSMDEYRELLLNRYKNR